MIFDRLESFGKSTALIEESGSIWTFEELVRQADRIAAFMEKRTVFFILCRNNVSTVATYVGALRRRVVPLLLRADIPMGLLQHLLNVYQPRYLWMDLDNTSSMGTELYSDGQYKLLETGYPSYDIHKDLALLMSTSGSTGSPKLVRQSYRNIIANTASIIEYLSLSAEDRAITTLPMYYTYGLSIVQTQLASGGSLVLTDASLFERRFWELLKSHKVTNFGGVPYTYEMLKRMRFSKMNLPSLRFMTQAGGKLAPKLSEEFARICRENGISFITMYGACEATARMSYLPCEHAEDKAGSIGIAIPGGRFAIEDVEGNPLDAPEVEGELIYYGENVTMGYAENKDDLLKRDERQGVLHTGDIARKDEDGFYYITGRKKRFLKLFGNRVSLDSVEAFLKGQGYTSCACAGEDDKLIVYTSETVDRKGLCSLLGKFTQLHVSAFSVVHVPEIPRNGAGKILYEKLKNISSNSSKRTDGNASTDKNDSAI